jgi:hypothetical protein
MFSAKQVLSRRNLLESVGTLSIAGALSALGPLRAASAATTEQRDEARASASRLTPSGAAHLNALMDGLAKAPRNRSFKTVPMILTDPNQWDHKALSDVLAYQPPTKQASDNSQIAGSWLDAISSTLNTEVWSFKHPEFLAVSATHGSAQLALYDQIMWDKYQLSHLAGEKFKTNILIVETKAASADPANFEDPAGVFSPADNSIPALMRRGVVFLACHHQLWQQAEKLIDAGLNPDGLTHGELAAELTNHLIPGVILTPGMVATLSELVLAGFQYVK